VKAYEIERSARYALLVSMTLVECRDPANLSMEYFVRACHLPELQYWTRLDLTVPIVHRVLI